jgi:hypothetical protein
MQRYTALIDLVLTSLETDLAESFRAIPVPAVPADIAAWKQQMKKSWMIVEKVNGRHINFDMHQIITINKFNDSWNTASYFKLESIGIR